MRKTKIVCTLGPATDDPKVLKKLFMAGLDVGRFNFSHGSHEEQLERLNLFRKTRDDLNLPAATLMDTKGPEVRIKTFKEGKITLKKGDAFTLTTEDIEGSQEIVSVSYSKLPQNLNKGDMVLIDDGLIELQVKDKNDKEIFTEVINGGEVGDRKGVNLPNTTLDIPFLSPKDREDILFGIEKDFDYIAASFVRSADDVKEIKNFLSENNGCSIKIISKIENNDGVRNIDEIIRVSDGIMVARGDMGVEVPFEEIPHIQKKIIAKTKRAGKPVITATQMLDSMMRNPRPTRAEITDVANAIYDGTGAIMLSGETAIGKYPELAVSTMAKIALKTEMSIDFKKNLEHEKIHPTKKVTDAISYSTCSAAHSLDAAAIISITKSGHTSRMVSRHRPACPIIASTPQKKVYHQLALIWGVIPLLAEVAVTTDEIFQKAVDDAQNANLLKNGDLVIITGGMPVGISGTTNMMKIHITGDLLVKGKSHNKLSTSGVVCVIAPNKSSAQDFTGGDILVIQESTDEILHLIRNAGAVITEEHHSNAPSSIVAKALDIPVITGAEGATEILTSGIAVKVDGEKGYVYSGQSKNI